MLLTISGCKTESEIVLYSEETESLVMSESQIQTEAMTVEETIVVYVSGAVIKAGIVELKSGARVYEAIEASGGLTAEADEQWLNQAARLEDGMQLRVLTKEEAETADENNTNSTNNTNGANEVEQKEAGKVNLNQATAEELKTLPGIGDSKAEDIIRYREEHGGFQAIEEIMNISGIKTAVFEKIKDKISV